MNVRVVLDTSALVAYAQLRGIAVGELVAMVEEDMDTALVGIPAACFLFAHAALDPDDRPRLIDLATKVDGVMAILPLLGAEIVECAELDGVMPEPGTAHAVIEARRRDALLATYHGDDARRVLSEDTVLDL